MIKKLSVLLLAVILSFALTIPSFAAIPTISYWHSTGSEVGYTLLEGSYCTYNLSQNSTFSSRFNTAVSAADSKWDAVLPLSIFSAPASYALYSIYGGTRTQLLSAFPDLSQNDYGCSLVNRTGTTHVVKYNDSIKTVHQLSVGKICIVEKSSATAAQYEHTAIHEMGHLFGWREHSSNSNDVMYSYISSITTLTARDKRHLKQIYTLFYS